VPPFLTATPVLVIPPCRARSYRVRPPDLFLLCVPCPPGDVRPHTPPADGPSHDVAAAPALPLPAWRLFPPEQSSPPVPVKRGAGDTPPSHTNTLTPTARSGTHHCPHTRWTSRQASDAWCFLCCCWVMTPSALPATLTRSCPMLSPAGRRTLCASVDRATHPSTHTLCGSGHMNHFRAGDQAAHRIQEPNEKTKKTQCTTA